MSMTKRIAGSWLVLATLTTMLFMSCATAGGTCLNTVTCCIEAHPGNPEACGLTASEAAAILAAASAATATTSAVEEWDDSHNANLPEWKRRCIRNYGDCKDGLFSGPCYDCLRRCEGQQEWPLDICEAKGRKRR